VQTGCITSIEFVVQVTIRHMSQPHAFLQAAWESGDDPAVLLVFADWLEERGDPTAEIIRLVAAEAGTARHSNDRAARLKQLRDSVWKTVRQTTWPDMAVQGEVGAVAFSRRPNPDRPAREHMVIRPDRKTIHWLRADVDGSDEVIGTRDGRELLRRTLLPETLDFIAGRRDYYWGAGFTLAEDYFPLPHGWQQNPRPALTERRRRVDEALAPAAIQMNDLPAELLPYVAWALAEYVCDKRRRARGGHVVPGAHIFLFCTGPWAWRHCEAVQNRNSGAAAAILRSRFRMRALHAGPRPGEGAVMAGLLARVSDERRITARKVTWVGPGGEVRETTNLPRVADTLSAEDFQKAVDDLRGVVVGAGGDPSRLAEAFVANTPEKLRALFASLNTEPGR
jgi:uncharacterized protein (TIGR02996 family)